jgi:hypothetical protein
MKKASCRNNFHPQLFHSSLVTPDLASKTESAEYVDGGSAGDCGKA